MSTPSTIRKTEWRIRTDKGLRCIKARWVTKADYDRLQPVIDDAANRAERLSADQGETE